MIQHIVFVAALVSASAAFALLEIQIEGDRGWAAGLPTWRIENRWTRRILGGRPLTGYHVYFHLLVLLFSHLPYALSLVRVSWPAELRILSFVVLLWVLEDFLWFVLNPHWGVRAFRRRLIPWHAPDWWWFMPRDYWIFIPMGVAMYGLSWII
jgi:hypothetical protein